MSPSEREAWSLVPRPPPILARQWMSLSEREAWSLVPRPSPEASIGGPIIDRIAKLIASMLRSSVYGLQ